MPSLRIPLPTSLQNRSSSVLKDARLVNCYVEPIDRNESAIVKRPGLVTNTTVTAGTALGIFSWGGNLYEVRGTSLYKNGVPLGTVNGTGGMYYFAQTNDTTKMVLKNTTNGYYVTTGGVITPITDVNYPAVTVPGLVYLDGYFFVMDAKGTIYASALEDPSTWPALSYITAETEPDAGVFLAKHMNYVVALGSWTTEFFYDAANATGSPLSVASNAFEKIGCAHPGSVVYQDSTVIWMSQGQDKGREIYALNGLQPTRISDQFVETILDADSLAGVYSFSLKVNGRYLYAITLTASNITLVFDFTTRMWTQWSNGTSDEYFPAIAYAFNGGKDILQHETNGKTYALSPTTYQDDGVTINTRAVTPLFDGGNNQNKFLSSMQVIGDKVTSTLTFRYSDDDYTTFSSWLTVDLSKDKAQAYRLGRFRRRSFEVLHTDNTSLRLVALELNLDPGSS